jgi:asparagine synthase (glutamine-hydrolysing)
MSGLAGFVSLNGAPVAEDVLNRMAIASRYLAADGARTWNSAEAGLIRFASWTTPEAVNEQQPLRDTLTGCVICFDGRIDNREELFLKLDRLVELDRGAPDCAVVLALFGQFGEDCLSLLVGDYVLAIWQPAEHRLFCARSPLGWRPFQWYCDAKVFAFASDAKALIDGLQLGHRLNEGAIGEFLSMYFQTPTETFWQDIYRLPPGAALRVENGRIHSWHWHRGPFADLSNLPDDELIAGFQALFDQSIAACMRSSTEVSAHLSGGLDSSSIVCRAVELHRAGKIDTLVRPISARYPGEPYDESEWSGAVEEHLGINASIVTVDPYNWDLAAEWCAETYHLPLRPNTLGAAVSTCRCMRDNGSRVLLTGEGGDDWLAGSLAHWPDLLRQGQIRRLWCEGLNRGGSRSFSRTLASVVFRGAGPWVFPRMRRQLTVPHLKASSSVPDWIQPEWAAKIGLDERKLANHAPARFKSLAQQQRYARYNAARHYVNLENVIAFAASRGIEMRHPLHDLRLTTFIMGVPGSILLRNGEKKYLLRRAMRGTLPEKVRSRRSKADFTALVARAVSDAFRERDPERLLSVRLGWVEGSAIRQIFSEFRSWVEAGGLGPAPDSHLGAVWSSLAIDLWLRNVVGL